MNQAFKIFILLGCALLTLGSCKKKEERSSTTGWVYNDQKWGGFTKSSALDQATVLIWSWLKEEHLPWELLRKM
jgi:hypothetical protein